MMGENDAAGIIFIRLSVSDLICGVRGDFGPARRRSSRDSDFD
jgi:hypothetical protein